MAQCKACGRDITFVKLAKTGKHIPVETRRFSIVTDDGDVVTGRETHFAHCPNAARFRKEKKRNGELRPQP